jgi:hypothetical protein
MQHLVINLKTAKALGSDNPRAAQVIEWRRTCCLNERSNGTARSSTTSPSSMTRLKSVSRRRIGAVSGGSE